MKKSGRTPLCVPPAVRYRWKALPARKSAARGVVAISMPA
jgi:hypothetical protein